MTYTPDQIALCKQLYELGEKREPKVREIWIRNDDCEPVYIRSVEGEIVNVLCYYGLSAPRKKDLLHPLYSEGELLEMIADVADGIVINKVSGEYIVGYRYAFQSTISARQKTKSNNLLTALLKLAVEVTGK